jgi:penicillin-binding protein 2
MDIDTWAAYVKLFGFGSPTGIDLPDENDGVIAERAYKNKKYGRWGWAEGSLLHLAIGQGDILVTPLQMAQFIGIVAMKGDQYRPKLVKEKTKDRVVRIPIKSATWRTIHKMTFDVVNKRGGTAFDKELAASDVSAHGKTGTAENPHGDPHAWFVGFAEGKGETIAISKTDKPCVRISMRILCRTCFPVRTNIRRRQFFIKGGTASLVHNIECHFVNGSPCG